MDVRPKHLDADSVCAIIRVCSECHVAKLKYRGLDVSFIHSPPAEMGRAEGPAEIESPKQIADDVFTADEVRTREDQLAELLLTDPAAHEELVAVGELTDEDRGAESALL